MNLRTILIGVILVLCLAPSAVPAQEQADPNRIAYWSVHLENDLWGDGKDRHYTHGSKISVAPAGDPPE